jgi:2-polyprenyl-6-hydroxyphenyl methylase/3-demethylubiquinone-9 3-methyltransferase
MVAKLEPVMARQKPCKCCGGTASLYGVVDFHKNCLNVQHPALALSGVPVYYHRCPACGFLFTTAFDHFTKEDFHNHIYNSDYILVDPDYRDARPRANAQSLAQMFPGIEPQRILDYGGGEGLLGQVLGSMGRRQVDTYDPFVARFAARPPERYDCIVSFEVLEHTPDPRRTLGDMNELLSPGGLILFSTLLQPWDIDQQGLNWWYAAPRNGHVSLYSRASLQKVVQPLGFQLASFNDNFHALFRRVPQFASHFLHSA